MSQDERIFAVVNAVAAAGWLPLIFLPGWRLGRRFVSAWLVPAALGLTYAWLVATALPGAEGGFGSLAEVAQLFDQPAVLLAGWIHYLAFDLFVGAWEARDARRRKIPHLLVVPCLLLTFALGPVGFLAYLALRAGLRQVWSVDEGDGDARLAG